MTRKTLAALALAGISLAAREAAGVESNCPGAPYQCALYTTCAPITWCEPYVNCNMLYQYRARQKTYYIKRCTYNGDVVFCSYCGDPGGNGCCPGPKDMVDCPTGSSCQ